MFSRWFDSTFESLRDQQYRMLWIGSTIAFLAFMMSMIVQSIVAFDLTGKNGAVGVVALGMGIATIGIAPFGGVIADRVSKRKLVLIGQSIIGVDFLIVGLMILTDTITIPLLAVSTFVMGAVFSFIGPARQAWIGEIVKGPEIGNAIAMQQMGMTLTRVLGPLAVAALVAVSFIGTGGTYLTMAGMFAFVIFTLNLLKPTKSRPAEDGKSILNDFKLGFTHIVSRPRLLLLVVSFMGVIMFGFSYQVVLPGLLENELGHDAKDMGLLFFAGALSGLVVTLLIASKASGPHAWKMMIAGGLVLGISLALTSVVGSFWHAMVTMFVAGSGASVFQLLNNSLIMQNSERDYYGRVMSLTMMAWGLQGLIGFPFGLFADAVGERETLFLMGALVLATTVATALIHVSLNRRLERQPAGLPTLAGGK
ncbi:MAG: MFS transporter [Dehalococcoidia bacterium]